MMGRVAAILIALLCILMFAFGYHIQNGTDNGLRGMLLYQFCHVNIWHLLGNMAALYSIESSKFRTPMVYWLLAYVISVVAPCTHPTEGMSGMLYAMMGILSWQAAYKMKFHMWCAGFMAVCFLFPNSINAWIHVYCYGVGVCLQYIILGFPKTKARF